MLEKSSRAFRTISEAGEELDLKPHVLRFWEAKFSDLNPVTRAGGRRFYRPEDINFLRGLRILLHDEKHKIKDVQKLIKLRGAQSVVELGESAVNVRPSRPIKQRDLVPERIKGDVPTASPSEIVTKIGAKADSKSASNIVPFNSDAADADDGQALNEKTASQDSRFLLRQPSLSNPVMPTSSPIQPKGQLGEDAATKSENIAPQSRGLDAGEKAELEIALDRLSVLRKRWEKFT